ncbi:MAG: alpha/beta hydrolase [bacterium]
MSASLPEDNPGPHSPDLCLTAGEPFDRAEASLIMLHGRGATAESIIGLAEYLDLTGFHIVAPQADNYTWYPYSFLEDTTANEPYVSSALATIDTVVERLRSPSSDLSRVYLLGFSQGACLVSEYAARAAAKGNGARRFGGLVALSGGLIGPRDTVRSYSGSLAGTPAFLGCSDVDMHIPEERVRETADTLSRLGSTVDLQIYPGMGHTINKDEIAHINTMLARG